MKLEAEKLRLIPFSWADIRATGLVRGKRFQFRLNTLQVEIFELLLRSFSIDDVVDFFLQKKILISFQDFFQLLSFLVDENMILNPGFSELFYASQKNASSGPFTTFIATDKNTSPARPETAHDVHQLPFFRSLAPQTRQALTNHMRLAEVPRGITLCLEGQAQRTLFVLLEGQVSVWKKNENGTKQCSALLNAGSVFGEVGFFLGQPRSADLRAETKCRVAMISHTTIENVESLMPKDKMGELQKRLWLIHALLKSDFLGKIPEDCFDSVLFAGRVRSFSSQGWIFREGDFGECCYLIIQGTVQILQKGVLIRNLSQGDCFGEIALLRNQGNRSASAYTQGEVMALEIQAPKFYKLLSQNLFMACNFEKLALFRLNADVTRRQKKA